MPEWSNGAVSKTVVLFRVPGVRIPFSPQQKMVKLCFTIFCFLRLLNACIQTKPQKTKMKTQRSKFSVFLLQGRPRQRKGSVIPFIVLMLAFKPSRRKQK